MSRYSDWLKEQDDEFKQEVNPQGIDTDHFIDYRTTPIDLATLEQLDSKYCGTNVASADDLE